MVQVQGAKRASVARSEEKHSFLKTLYLSVIPKPLFAAKFSWLFLLREFYLLLHPPRNSHPLR